MLTVVLVASAGLKLSSGHDRQLWLGAAEYYAIATTELGLAVALLLTRGSAARWVAVTTMLFFVGATAIQWIVPSGKSCGCLGGMEISRAGQMALAAGCGLVACAHLTLSHARRGKARHE